MLYLFLLLLMHTLRAILQLEIEGNCCMRSTRNKEFFSRKINMEKLIRTSAGGGQWQVNVYK